MEGENTGNTVGKVMMWSDLYGRRKWEGRDGRRMCWVCKRGYENVCVGRG